MQKCSRRGVLVLSDELKDHRRKENMETLHTIAHNFHVLANANINWSPDGGMFWLTSTVMVTVLGMLLLSRSN
jgi:hypothetical protein